MSSFSPWPYGASSFVRNRRVTSAQVIRIKNPGGRSAARPERVACIPVRSFFAIDSQSSLRLRSSQVKRSQSCGRASVHLQQPRDTRNVGEPKLFLADDGIAHYVREVEVLLAAGRVTPELVNSDLFCGIGGVGGCVGNILIVDEITFDILAKYPRCHTC